MKTTENGNLSGKREFWDKLTDDTLDRIAEKVKGAITVPAPYISDDGYWMVWDSGAKVYVKTEVEAEGYTPVRGVDYFTEEEITAVMKILQEYAYDSAVFLAPYIASDGYWWIDAKNLGVKAAGQDGYTPVKGVDYWNERDKADIIESVLAALPDADTMSFPLENTVSEVNEE